MTRDHEHNMRRHIVTAVSACAAFAVSAWTIGWLRKSSEHADRPPLFAIAAFFVALVAGVVGLLLCVRVAKTVLRDLSRETPE
jgi:uncharacterized membrane protein YcjF (UPF0283 family)